MPIIRVGLVSVLALLSLSACVAPGCYEPAGAAIRPPLVLPLDGHALGQCQSSIRIDGLEWVQSNNTYDLDGADLEPIGEADETSHNTPALAGPTIYEIAGVDSDEAIAMERWDGQFIVFLSLEGSLVVPPELCRTLPPQDSEGCE